MRDRAFGFTVALMAMLVLTSCEHEKDSRGLDYMPDMYHSPAYRTQEARAITVDVAGKAEIHHVPMMLVPPEGSVPRDFLPYQIAIEDQAAAKAALNPLAATPDVLRQGQWAYGIYCAVCHGNDGDTKNGYVSHKLATPPPVLNGVGLLRLSDGEIYHIITHGRVRMPNYRAQLLPETRWATIHYVRALNRAAVAKTEADAALVEAEEALKKNPDDADTKAKVADARRMVEAKKLAQQQTLRGGDGTEFLPPPAAVPEYIKPSWLEK